MRMKEMEIRPLEESLRDDIEYISWLSGKLYVPMLPIFGADNPQELECPRCHVISTYTIYKTEQESRENEKKKIDSPGV